MRYTAAVITISDKGYAGQREDTSGPALVALLEDQIWDVVHTQILPDDRDMIEAALRQCADEKHINLILTTGGTGFAARDITPEAALAVIERQTPGIPAVMVNESMKITDRACLSRCVAGIRGNSLIITLPGSKKAAVENISSVISPLAHGMEMLSSEGSANCAPVEGEVLKVCISEKKGTVKRPVDEVHLRIDHGIEGDAHAGNWHRQVSMLAQESVDKAQKAITDLRLQPGDFAENILTRGIVLYELPVGTRLEIGETLCEVTQIGKECHADCAIRQKTGDCVMPREGIFVKVLRPGTVRPGDKIISVT